MATASTAIVEQGAMPQASPTDASSGVSERLTAIWLTERKRLISRAYLILRNSDLAEDMASEALVRCLEAKPVNCDSLAGYLHTTCRNLALSAVMAEKKLASPEWLDRLETDDEALNSIFASQCIAQLCEVPELAETIKAMIEADGDMAIAGESLGITSRAIRLRMQQARKRLGVLKLGRNMPRECATGITGSTFMCRSGHVASISQLASVVGLGVMNEAGETIAFGTRLSASDLWVVNPGIWYMVNDTIGESCESD